MCSIPIMTVGKATKKMALISIRNLFLFMALYVHSCFKSFCIPFYLKF
jgi:hypothetical protein